MEPIEVVNTTTTTATNTTADGGDVENKKVEEGKIVEAQKKNRIQVSNTKKPLFFYLNLAKVFSLSSTILSHSLKILLHCFDL